MGKMTAEGRWGGSYLVFYNYGYDAGAQTRGPYSQNNDPALKRQLEHKKTV
jgi:hypothetical protein